MEREEKVKLVQNSTTSPEVLESLSKDSDYWIRLNVAWNPNTSQEVLTKLVNDRNEEVSEMAKEKLLEREEDSLEFNDF